jgi:thiamine-monophosphate kinase
MSDEYEFLARLRTVVTHEGARGLMDDVALLSVGDTRLILTSDTIVEGVHYLAADPPADIGWKLAAVNLSDLAAKGAKPLACLLNYSLSGDGAWDAAFLDGLHQALDRFAMPLLGGDTVQMPAGSARSYSLTAIGQATGPVPTRAGAQAGDTLYLTGPVGDAGVGLDLLRADRVASGPLVDADDGRVGRPADRCRPHGAGERRRNRHRPYSPVPRAGEGARREHGGSGRGGAGR